VSVQGPLSWLTLERYALGELPSDERDAIKSALAQDEMARAWLSQIETEQRTLPALPPLLVDVTTSSKRHKGVRGARLFWSRAFVAAAALLLAILIGPFSDDSRDGPSAIDHASRSAVAVKGGQLVIGLVRLRSGATSHQPKTFVATDSFQVLVSCPPRHRGVTLRAVIEQGGKRYYPWGRRIDGFQCGNRVLLDGAFSIDGKEDAWVCVKLEIAPRAGSKPPPRACARLRPR
jgi:hypothetical protein